jgi:hypothetical protein
VTKCLPFHHDWEPRSWRYVTYYKRYGRPYRHVGEGTQVTHVCARCDKVRVKEYVSISAGSAAAQ